LGQDKLTVVKTAISVSFLHKLLGLGFYQRSLKPLRLESGREVGGQAGKLAAKGSDAFRPHGVALEYG
jgi:hypothetical protein